MYYLSVLKGKDKGEVVASKSFDDFGHAMAACSDYYNPKAHRAVLSFTTEAINGKFARAYAELNRPEDIDIDSTDIDSADGNDEYQCAIKQANVHDYDSSFLFLIESDFGIQDADNT